MAAGSTVRTLPTAKALAKVRRIFATRHESGAAPSTVYGVLAGGELVAGDGFGALDGAGTRPTVDTAYRIASVTKSFTAAALLLLRDRGLIDLDEPITAIVPQLRLRLPTADSPVPTVRMLAHMSGGLASDDPWADRQEALTDEAFDAAIGAGVRAIAVPGTTFEYSNLGYALIGRVIQERAGCRFHDVVRTEVLEPLGLSGTGWDSAVPSAGGVAIGFERIDDAWSPMPFSAPGAFSPIGGLFSTVTDLARWMQWFVDADDPARAAAGPLSAASRREMQQGVRMRPVEAVPRVDRQPRAAYGFGLVEQVERGRGTVVYHSGGYPGFSAHIRWHPATGIGVVALENATYAGVSVPAAAAMAALLDATDLPPACTPWPETVAAQQALTGVLRSGWDDAKVEGLFTANVAEDRSYERRRAQITDRVGAHRPTRRGLRRVERHAGRPGLDDPRRARRPARRHLPPPAGPAPGAVVRRGVARALTGSGRRPARSAENGLGRRRRAVRG